MIAQCLDEDRNVLSQETKFSFDEYDYYELLPPGCPPPIITPQNKEDPCKDGYKVGQVISTVIANLIVPRFIHNKPGDPFVRGEEFMELQRLELEIEDANLDTINQQ